MSLNATDFAKSGSSAMEKSALEPQLSNDVESGDTETLISAGSQHLHRKLRGKEVQLFAIGGAIGTCNLPAIRL